MPSNILPERQVAAIWQDCLRGRTDLVTEEGEPIGVIYPGRINHDRGADFLDAVITTSRGLIRGDVEVHARSTGWRAHRHHQDPVYNRVVLHVVYWRDTAAAVSLHNGRNVPTLALHRFIENQTGQKTGTIFGSAGRFMPCRNTLNRWHTSATGEILDTAGEERFLAKAAGFQIELTRTDEGQCLYQGIMGALGYTKNKHPLLELSRRMPLHRLQSMASSKTPDTECLARQQALLIGIAGLLPSQRTGCYQTGCPYDEWVEKLESVWASFHETATMSEDDWHFFKVRPGNFPVRRMAAMSHLVLRYRKTGIFAGLVNELCNANADTGHTVLEKSLYVNADGYWARHLDFGLPGRGAVPALLGSGRAADIIVNVLLPFAVARGRVSSHQELLRNAFELYRHYPALPANTLERHMASQLGINRYLVNSARRQQGLIHIYRTLCSQGKCHDCPLGSE